MSENFQSFNSEKKISNPDHAHIETLTFISRLREKMASEGYRLDVESKTRIN